MTKKSDALITSAIVNSPEAIKPNISEIARSTGLSRNTIGNAFKRVWESARVRFVISPGVNSTPERAVIAVKLLDNSREAINAAKQVIAKCTNVCEILVVEGTDADLMVKVVAGSVDDFSKSLFDLKEVAFVASANVA